MGSRAPGRRSVGARPERVFIRKLSEVLQSLWFTEFLSSRTAFSFGPKPRIATVPASFKIRTKYPFARLSCISPYAFFALQIVLWRNIVEIRLIRFLFHVSIRIPTPACITSSSLPPGVNSSFACHISARALFPPDGSASGAHH